MSNPTSTLKPLPAGYSMHGLLALPRLVIRAAQEDKRVASLAACLAESIAIREKAAAVVDDSPIDAELISSRDRVGSSLPTDEEFEIAAEFGDRRKIPVVHMDDVRAAAAAATAKTRSADGDRNASLKNICKTLLIEGGHRAVAGPQDRHQAVAVFEQQAPHMRELSEMLRVAAEVAHRGRQPIALDPILLVGAPGLGKTYVADLLATALETKKMPTVSYAAQGAAGNTLSGADKAWSNSCAGQVFLALVEGTWANPLFLLDEIDKAGTSTDSYSRKRDPLSELLPLLERATAREHRDKYAEIRTDASHIFWIATANSLSSIPGPLLSRMRIIHVRAPGVRESFEILNSIAWAVLLELGLHHEIKAPSGAVRRVMVEMTPRLMRPTMQPAPGSALAP